MATKLNIFNALPNVPSDDEDTHHSKTGAQSKVGGDKAKKDRIRKKGPKQDTVDAKGTGKDTHVSKDLKSRDHQLKKKGNDLDHPHTLDRKSGTGEPAFAKNQDKKGGYGKFNKGSYKDDFKGTRGEGERNEEEGEQESEEEDNTVTLDEYLGNTTTATEFKQQVNDVKNKITDDQIKKELGKATLLENRSGKPVNDHTETRGKNTNAPILGMNTEHAELLGFRTGFKVFDEKKRRQNRDRNENPAEKKEGEATTEQTEEKKGEENKPEAPEDKGKTGEEESPSGQRGGYKGNRRGGDRKNYEGGHREGGHREGGHREGGYREGGNREGGNRGGYKGDNKGGYKGENRGPRVIQKAVNIEDDASFPKLG